MKATETFTLRISPEEREILSRLANKLGRSESGTIRFVVRETWKTLQPESKSMASPLNDDLKQEGSNVTH